MEYKRKFIIFIIIFGFLLSVVFYSLYRAATTPYVALVGALLGGIIALIPFSYINFVENPNLKIIWDSDEKKNDIHSPSMTILRGQTTVERKHIRVIVRNDGKKVAKSCCATIHIEEDGRVDGCISFSSEPKDLKWVTPFGNNETTRDIYPHGGEQYLEVIFADNHEPYSLEGGICKIDRKEKAPLWAYASTPLAFGNPFNRNQDGFCKGRFNIGLTVYSETAKPVRERFQLNITGKWDTISVSKLSGRITKENGGPKK
jgi:hypothetical protein